ncbi:uncharacterized protein LOC143207103 isoform X2 [Lasioglossum baleicum]|uniref:uncharacterized protein LOC143207103 isoform X2 n=1 Tax=Lasioglossum baleicum TaxID=434251 RepID=UPI003FCD3B4D
MHFWIDKPAGRYYGFTGRRYPATALPKISYNRRRYNVDSRQMVATPLHRFHSLSATGNSAGPSNVNNCRAMQTTIRPSNNENQNSFPVGSTRRVQPNNIPNNVTTAGNNQLILSNTTPNGTNMSLLFFSDFNDTLLARCNLRRCVYTIFIVAIGFVIAGRFYFRDEEEQRKIKETEIKVGEGINKFPLAQSTEDTIMGITQCPSQIMISRKISTIFICSNVYL